MAKNAFLDWSTTASSNTDVGGIGILGTNAVSNFDDALRTTMAQLRAGVDGEVVYATKSGNYTPVANDNNAVHRYTATATAALTAAATLGVNWHYTIVADGGDVTIDPNASETINGVATLVVKNGATATIICDGSNFFTVMKPMVWEFIRTVAGAGTPTQVQFTDLGSFKDIQLRGTISGSAATTALLLRTSTNNGSSYDSGATDYSVQVRTIQNGTQTGASAQATSVQLGPASGFGVRAFIKMDITNFNQAAVMQAEYVIGGLDAAAAIFKTDGWGQRSSTSARNAFSLFVSAGTFLTWDFSLFGVRG